MARIGVEEESEVDLVMWRKLLRRIITGRSFLGGRRIVTVKPWSHGAI